MKNTNTNCIFCNKPIDETVKRFNKKFCSNLCYGRFKSGYKEYSVNCRTCGDEFKTFIHNQVYCSDKCRPKYLVDRKITHKVICKRCGNEFETTVHNKLYCSPACANNSKKNKKHNCQICKKAYYKVGSSKTCSKACSNELKAIRDRENKAKMIKNKKILNEELKEFYYHNSDKDLYRKDAVRKNTDGIITCKNNNCFNKVWFVGGECASCQRDY